MKKPLNPFAAEYNPIPPGIYPDPHAPPPFFFSPPPHPLEPPRPQPSLFLSSQIFTYIPSSAPQPIYTNYSTTYYVNPQIPTATNIPSPSPPPPPPQQQSPARTRYGQPGKGCSRQRGGFRVGIGRGRENYSRSTYNRVEKDGRVFISDKNSDGFRRGDTKFFRRSMQQRFEKETRHKVMPLKRDEEKTTIMIRNIPYSCPRKYLINFLDEFCSLENARAKEEGTSQYAADDEGLQHFNNASFTTAYDFLYLPMDFRTKNSRGYAFVNFTTARAASNFSDRFHRKKNWDFVQFDEWPKKIEVACAEIQGKEAAVKHASETHFECETDEFLPVCFDPARDGSGQPVHLTVIGNRRAAASEYHRETRYSNHHDA